MDTPNEHKLQEEQKNLQLLTQPTRTKSYSCMLCKSAKLNFTVVINPVHLTERWRKANPCNNIEQVTKELRAHTEDVVHHDISDCWKRSRVECAN